MDYYAINRSGYLSHHGVLGMKWGVRKAPHPIRKIATGYHQTKASLYGDSDIGRMHASYKPYTLTGRQNPARVFGRSVKKGFGDRGRLISGLGSAAFSSKNKGKRIKAGTAAVAKYRTAPVEQMHLFGSTEAQRWLAVQIQVEKQLSKSNAAAEAQVKRLRKQNATLKAQKKGQRQGYMQAIKGR